MYPYLPNSVHIVIHTHTHILVTHRTIMIHPIRCHFSFPATVQDKVKLKVFEEMAECVFNIQAPIELL